MSINIDTLVNEMETHAQTTGYFDRVNMHEPKNAPGHGLTAAVWADSVTPLPTGSGANSTSVRVVFNIRIYTNMLQEPQDAIDPNIFKAVDSLMDSFSSDFELGGNVRGVDLLGMYGVAMSAQAGYLEQDRKLYRVVTVTVPLIVNDVWTQEG